MFVPFLGCGYHFCCLQICTQSGLERLDFVNEILKELNDFQDPILLRPKRQRSILSMICQTSQVLRNNRDKSPNSFREIACLARIYVIFRHQVTASTIRRWVQHLVP
jgi:hypothetical protein